ncbi:GNAT family N-acetyltransferase [Vibrio sp. SCSIO 43137]|uniref:GNAT family N-acetyltransferase n=1 Tax=Vibrio sp. SCSIO 43137 TaxID=3021011 RepID=UPI00230782C2|nr:GNAT family N-acetyltransferase [Vibrio sp. SCSIO 43137]WCE30804.1 GNAT family N-acetyltransferase [Vibrio sp. SCSIO 43137]
MQSKAITTERLTLTPVSGDDLDIYTTLLTSKETTRYLPGGKPFYKTYIENYLQQKLAHWQKGYGTFIVSLKQSGVKIGYAGVESVGRSDSREELNDIRYALLPEFYDKGYAEEAARAVIDFTFRQAGLNVIYGVAVLENTPSVKLLNKLGMSTTSERLYDSDDLVTMKIMKIKRTYMVTPIK